MNANNPRGGFYIKLNRKSKTADLRTDGVKQVRIARELSGVEPQVQKRNFPSVEQIQDKSRLRHHKKESLGALFYYKHLVRLKV